MWLVGGQIYDVNEGTFRRGDLCIEDGRIAKIGNAASGSERIDLSGAYLLPGFIDCHVHICVNTQSPDPSRGWAHASPGKIAIWAACAARRMLMAGFTSAREVGGWDYHEIAVREAIDEKLIIGSRLFCAGRILSITSATTPYYPGMYEEADGADAVRRAARKQFANGANFIKILASGAHNASKYERADSIQYRPDEIRAAVEIAKDRFSHVAAHAHAAEAVRNSVLCGCRSVEHGTYATEELYQLMVEHGTYLVPTVCTTPAMFRDESFAAQVPDHIRKRQQKLYATRIANLRLARQLGVKVAMGSDAGTPGNHCGNNMLEVELMVTAAGFSPAEAILSATLRGAEVLGEQESLGSLEVGKIADVIAVRRNPLDDISVLNEVSFVMKDGEVARHN